MREQQPRSLATILLLALPATALVVVLLAIMRWARCPDCDGYGFQNPPRFSKELSEVPCTLCRESGKVSWARRWYTQYTHATGLQARIGPYCVVAPGTMSVEVPSGELYNSELSNLSPRPYMIFESMN